MTLILLHKSFISLSHSKMVMGIPHKISHLLVQSVIAETAPCWDYKWALGLKTVFLWEISAQDLVFCRVCCSTNHFVGLLWWISIVLWKFFSFKCWSLFWNESLSLILAAHIWQTWKRGSACSAYDRFSKAESGLCEISIVLGFLLSHRMLFINCQPRSRRCRPDGYFYTASVIYSFLHLSLWH